MFKKITLIIFLFFPLVSFASITDYHQAGPLSVRTQNPLYLKFLAMPLESPQTIKKKSFQFSTQTTFSNVFEYTPVGNTLLNLDMEIWRTSFVLAYGLTQNIDVQIELPFITNSGGFLDSFIQGYHDVFGFPNGGRELVSDNEFHYELSQNGNTLLSYSRERFGFSDIVVRAKYYFSKQRLLPIQLGLSGFIKLPTGRTSKGLSSGQMDVGVSLLGQKSFQRWHFVTQLGLSVFGEDAVLTSIQKRAVFVFGQSVEFQLFNACSLIAQITGNTAAFDKVTTTDLTDPVVDLNIGFAGRVPVKNKWYDTFFYQWSFGEDVISRGPSVDFSVLFLGGVTY